LRRAVFLRALGGLVESLPPSHIKVSVLLAEGQLHHAMKVALLCAREFTETQQFLKAIELLEEVVEAIRDESDLDRVMSGRIHLLHADVLMRVRPMDRALARSLTIARALAQQPVTLTHVALLQARQHRQLGHYPAFRKTVNTAWAHVSETADAALKSRVASYQMQAWLTLGQMDPATEWMRVSGHWAALSEDESVVATARLFSGHLALIQGRLRDAETQLSMSIALFQRTNDRRGLWLAIPFWAEALRFQGRFSEALARLYRELPQARQSHMPLHYLRFLLVIARCEVDLCRLGKAQDCVDELEVNIRRGEQLSLRLDTQLVKGRIQLMSGQNREAKVILETAHEQARQAELPVTAASARALLGEAMWGVHAYEEAAVFFETSRVALVSSGDMASLAQATRSSARGLRGTASPEVVFEPVAQFLAEEPAEVLRLEQCLARARHFRDCGRAPESHEQYCQAVEQLSRLSQSLNETDKAALRVHPWAVQIRIGMR